MKYFPRSSHRPTESDLQRKGPHIDLLEESLKMIRIHSRNISIIQLQFSTYQQCSLGWYLRWKFPATEAHCWSPSRVAWNCSASNPSVRALIARSLLIVDRVRTRPFASLILHIQLSACKMVSCVRISRSAGLRWVIYCSTRSVNGCRMSNVSHFKCFQS